MGFDEEEGGEEDTYAWREPDVNGELGEFLRRVGPDANTLRMKYRAKEMEVQSPITAAGMQNILLMALLGGR